MGTILPSATASQYVATFVSTAATGAAMNDAGDVAGQAYRDPGCAPFCLATLETVVWRGGAKYVLPGVPGYTGSSVRGMNKNGWIVGVAGVPGTTTRAVLWRPGTSGYTAMALNPTTGNTLSEATGLDSVNRVLGWSGTLNIFQPYTPTLWQAGSGPVDLFAAGYPREKPEAVSPGGMVATANWRYRLGSPGSAVAQPAPPTGFVGQGSSIAINDNGDQARFLITTSSSNLSYPFRLNAGGTWQQLSTIGTGRLARYGTGGINNASDITLTVLSSAMVADGPNGLATGLSSRLAPSYGGAAISSAGPMNAQGEILASVFLGRSARLMKLVPAVPCTSNCARVNSLTMTGVFVQDPRYPGSCFQGGSMYNDVTARVNIRDENGNPLRTARVYGRFLDDYYLDRPVVATTGVQGNTMFRTRTTCGVGAVAFLVDSIGHGTRRFDKTTGTITNWVIPQ